MGVVLEKEFAESKKPEEGDEKYGVFRDSYETRIFILVQKSQYY